MAYEAYIQLTFITDEGNKANIRVPKVNVDLNTSKIDTAMEAILQSNSIQSSAGTIVAKESATIVSYIRRPISLA